MSTTALGPEQEGTRPSDVKASNTPTSLRVASLFTGIGGIELGLHEAGHRTEFMCEIDDGAKAVLARHFGIAPEGDIATVPELPDVDLVTAGFPCQDLSQAGRTKGIRGNQSSLVEHVFTLLGRMDKPPRWLLLENVPFMLQLDRGEAMRYLTRRLSELEFAWAYRIVDTRAFGLPQRRRRVILVASKTDDPRRVLFTDDAGERSFSDGSKVACGFYWTEGTRGLGWAVDAIPTLKGGSGLGIPSPPAIRLPSGQGIVVPEIRDAERLQGFPSDWTLPATTGDTKRGQRWRMVGNAVSVPLAAWVGKHLAKPSASLPMTQRTLSSKDPWPNAAWGTGDNSFVADFSPWPVSEPYQHLNDFLRFERKPLSERATAGFLSRARASTLRFPPGFIAEIEAHLSRMRGDDLEAA